jgi:hypothetical protein
MSADRSLAQVTVNPDSLHVAVDGFGNFTLLAGGYLQAEGLATVDPDGKIHIPPDVWPPLSRWLSALEQIRQSIGDRMMRQIGEAVPKRAAFPPTISDVKGAFLSANAAYHMNHRLRGEAMFNPATGEVLQGIGNYSCTIVGPGHIRVEGDSPYPCGFDFGICSGLATRFGREATVAHEPGECREKGGSRCAYSVRWAE